MFKHELGEIAARLSRALEYSAGEMSIEFVMDKILNREMVLWELEDPDILVVTQISRQEHGFRVHIFLAEGTFSQEHLEYIEMYARRIGAKGVQWTGRRGWSRKVKEFGYHEQYVTMMKDFEDE